MAMRFALLLCSLALPACWLSDAEVAAKQQEHTGDTGVDSE